ncbi:MAG: hypothetical protein AAB863_01085 [Patescibacteria group bacterium]
MEQNFISTNWDKMHHAYIVSGTRADEIWSGLDKNLSFKKTANPDAYSRDYETFGIDEARELSEWGMMRPLSGERKAAVISATSFTAETQNALLKLFEEPPAGTYFFVIVPNLGVVLPTLLSRVVAVSLQEKEEANKKLDSFLENSIAGRLSMVSSIIKSKDKEKARIFIVSLEKKISQLPNNFVAAKKILQAERYVGARGASLKIILEYLAISLPNVKL